MMAEQPKSIGRVESAEQYVPAPGEATREWTRQRKILFLLGSSIALWAMLLGAIFLIF